MPSFKQPSVIGAVFQNSKILLVKRRDVPVWVLPGGGVDKEEGLEEALRREIWEESGFHVKVLRKVGEYFPINRLANYTHLFECTLISGEATLSQETREVEFFDIDNLPSLPPPYLDWIQDCLKQEKEIIQKYLTGINYTILLKYLFLHPILVFRFLLARLGRPINR